MVAAVPARRSPPPGVHHQAGLQQREGALTVELVDVVLRVPAEQARLARGVALRGQSSRFSACRSSPGS